MNEHTVSSTSAAIRSQGGQLPGQRWIARAACGAACVGLLFAGAGVGNAQENPYPNCGNALVKTGVSTAAGALGGPLGAIGGFYSSLPDVYTDCPPITPMDQNIT